MKRQIALSIAALFVLGSFSEAMALDGWRDRKGMLYGAHVGAGSAQSDQEGAESRFGFNAGARVGAGVNTKLTLDASFNYRSDDKDGVETSGLSFMVSGNYFIVDGLYARLGGGLVTFSASTAKDTDDETGLGIGLGLGYEVFANSDLAIGFGVGFDHQRFDDFNMNVFTLNISSTMY